MDASSTRSGSIDTAELFFEDVRVDFLAVIGDVDGGFIHMMQNLLQERINAAVSNSALPTLDGTLVKLGMPEHPMALPAPALVFGRHRPAGSLIGGIAEMQEMLDFCAEHEVHPEIEVIAPGYINEAYERMLASDVRYRFVIDTQSLRA